MKKTKKKIDFDQLPEIISAGITVVEKELAQLAAKAEKEELSDADSKKLIAYISILKDVKKDHLAELKTLKEELKGLTDEQLKQLAGK